MDHRSFFRKALFEAFRSPDPSTQNGAVIVATDTRTGQPTVVGRGANEFPHMVRITEERLERPLKYSFIEHAERNAIFDYLDHLKMMGNEREHGPLHMYALWAACSDCARAIIQAGVHTVHTHSFYTGGVDPTGQDRKDWGESIRASMDMFAEANVEVVFHDMKIMEEGESLLFNSEYVTY